MEPPRTSSHAPDVSRRLFASSMGVAFPSTCSSVPFGNVLFYSRSALVVFFFFPLDVK